MTDKKIIFTIKSITKENNDQLIRITVNELDFPTGKGEEKTKITEMFFVGKEIDQIKDTFAANKTYQMTFGDTKVEDDRRPTMQSNTASAGGFTASKGPAKEPNMIVLEEDNKIRVVYMNHNESIKISEATATNQSGGTFEAKKEGEAADSASSSQSRPAGAKTASGDNSGGNSGTTNNNTTDNGSESDQADDEASESTIPTAGQSTQEEINKLNENLTKVKDKTATEEARSQAIKDIENEAGKSHYEAKKAEIENAKKEFARENVKKARETAVNTLEAKMSSNGVSKDELPSATKTKFEQLKNGEVDAADKISEIDQEVSQQVGNIGADKKFNQLKSEVDKALKSKDKDQIVQAKKNVEAFLASNNSFWQSKRSAATGLAQKLAKDRKQNNTGNNNKDGEGFPWKIVVPIALLVVVALVGIILYARKKRSSAD